jgi:hypothetical protein
MFKTYAARIETDGQIHLLEPLQLKEAKLASVTILEENASPRVQSKFAGAFSSGHHDTAERVDELLDELGFAE